MTTQLKSVDVAIVGMGWVGAILAKELAEAGLSVVGFERGRMQSTDPDFLDPQIHDELKYARRFELMQDLSRETLTFRNNSGQAALPMRRHGSFTIGEGLGGSGTHWGGVTWRWTPWDHEPLKHTLERYGRASIPEGMLLQDWGLSYAELEPYYERFEYVCGVSGKAGNIRGRIVDGGNPFEGPRQREYPLAPLTATNAGVLFTDAARRLGLHPFPAPAANASDVYVNPDGVQYNPCHYCGFCEGFACEADAKASPHLTILPLAMRRQNFQLRTNARVMKVNLDAQRRRAIGVTYIDSQGREFDQPAELVILAAYGLSNVHLMLLSGIGRPYDSKTGEGVVGRGYSYQIRSGALVFLDETKPLNPFMGTGALQVTLDDYYPHVFDHKKFGFIGGGTIQCASPGGRPIEFRPVPPGTPAWGTAWKRAVVQHYHHTLSIRNQSTAMSYRDNYLDLDPTYRDAYGRPMLRMTFDFHENEINLADFFADQCVKIGEAIGNGKVHRAGPDKNYSIVPYQSTHNTGGAVMGDNPKTSAINRYLQSWDVPNVFVIGANAFPQNAGKNPTGPVGALSYWAADAIKKQYLKDPGPMVRT